MQNDLVFELSHMTVVSNIPMVNAPNPYNAEYFCINHVN